MSDDDDGNEKNGRRAHSHRRRKRTKDDKPDGESRNERLPKQDDGDLKK